ncbi:MAG TPA: EamA family transporter [Anaerolineae bacterium]|nr:EamA family transporter [Anaerolineae bacterium]
MALLSVALGLASALTWGAGDFCGGLAARRSPVYGVVLVSQFVGLGLLAALAFFLAEPLPPVGDLLLAGTAGLAGGVGLLALYHGLAVGPMGAVAPIAAVISAGLPALFGTWFEGLPLPRQLVGFALALFAVWLLSGGGEASRVRIRSLLLAALAGLGFALFMILVGRLSESAVLWPLSVARVASILLLLAAVLVLRQSARPGDGQLPLLLLVGLLDTAGNTFYAMAARAGRLDVAAVVSSLYPAATVLLARSVLSERIAGRQWLGLLAALVAVLLIAR